MAAFGHVAGADWECLDYHRAGTLHQGVHSDHLFGTGVLGQLEGRPLQAGEQSRIRAGHTAFSEGASGCAECDKGREIEGAGPIDIFDGEEKEVN